MKLQIIILILALIYVTEAKTRGQVLSCNRGCQTKYLVKTSSRSTLNQVNQYNQCLQNSDNYTSYTLNMLSTSKEYTKDMSDTFADMVNACGHHMPGKLVKQVKCMCQKCAEADCSAQLLNNISLIALVLVFIVLI